MSSVDLTKKPHIKSHYTAKDAADLHRCINDPIFFIENFVKVQHPTKGSLPLILYDFQRDMINAYHEQRFTVALTSRQQGKCLCPQNTIRLSSPLGKIYEMPIGTFNDYQKSLLTDEPLDISEYEKAE